jgi:hypothetical protein
LDRTVYKETKTAKPDDGRTWVYANSSTSTLRRHIETFHPDEYQEACKTHGWEIMIESIRKNHQLEETLLAKKQVMKEPFTIDGFIMRLTSWITADDQVRATYMNGCFGV